MVPHRQQVAPSVFLDPFKGGLSLGVLGVQGHRAVRQVRLANYAESAEGMVLLEKPLNAATFFRFGDRYDLDGMVQVLIRPRGVGDETSRRFHTAHSENIPGKNPVTPALFPFLSAHPNFMHARRKG